MGAGSAFAQLDSNSVTVTASRNTTAQADQATLSVSVTSGFNNGLTDILNALAGTGITMANFTGLNSYSNPPQLTWSFTLYVPIAKLSDTTTSLANLQQSIVQKKNGLALAFSVQGTQVSQAPGCSQADLLADARVSAQKLADAAGLTVGVILAMSSTVSSTTGPAALSAFITSTTACTLTVKFALGRF